MCTTLPGGEMVKLVFEFVLGSFSGGKKCTINFKSLIIFCKNVDTIMTFWTVLIDLCVCLTVF